MKIPFEIRDPERNRVLELLPTLFDMKIKLDDFIHHCYITMNNERDNPEYIGDLFNRILEIQVCMDKQINKIKKDLDKGEKDTRKLLKMDKKQDKKLANCGKAMKAKKKK